MRAPRFAKSAALALAIVASLGAAAGCGAGSPSKGAPAHSTDVVRLERACARGWKFAASVDAALKLAGEKHVTPNGEVPQAIVERIGEPAGEASAAWTAASESARAAGYPTLAGLAAQSASDYGEVEFDLSPEGGGYEVTMKSLDLAGKTNAQIAKEASAHALKACATPTSST